ncbi:hypothetical protein D3C80_1068760 [compost metagenome]
MGQCVDIPKVEMALSWPEKLKGMKVDETIDISNDNSKSISMAMYRIHCQEDNELLFVIRKDTTGTKRVWRLK